MGKVKIEMTPDQWLYLSLVIGRFVMEMYDRLSKMEPADLAKAIEYEKKQNAEIMDKLRNIDVA